MIAISPLTLSSSFPFGVDVFCRQRGDEQLVLFSASDQIADEKSLNRIACATDLKLFIRKSDLAAFQKHLRDHFDHWFLDESLTLRNRATMLSEVVRNVLSEEFARNDTGRIVEESKRLGQQIAKLATANSLTGADLCQILHHDFGTFTHSGNVAFYCSLLANELGFSGADLADIVTGGLLHDLGKLDIDERILNKPDKLDELEFRTIKEHPLAGFRRLVRSNEASRIQLLMTYQHHERLDGKGYPVGISGKEIDIVSCICTVADVFEAMTSNRPYRGPIPHRQVLEIMSSEVNLAFDAEVFQCWSSVVNSRLSS